MHGDLGLVMSSTVRALELDSYISHYAIMPVQCARPTPPWVLIVLGLGRSKHPGGEGPTQ